MRTIFFGLNVYNMRAHIGEDTRGNTLAGVGERVWMVMVHAVRVHVCVCVAWRARERGSGSAACTRAHKTVGACLCTRGGCGCVGALFFFSRPMMKACMVVVRAWPQTVGPFFWRATPPPFL